MNKKVYISLLIICVAIVLPGCSSVPKCPRCPEMGSWSVCSTEAVKTKANYRCGEDTNFECQSYQETKNCATQILGKGRSMTMTIYPSIEKELKGAVTIELTDIPEEAEAAAFAIQGKDIPDIRTTGPNLGTDFQEGDGWSYILDTTRYENGVYDIYGMAFKEGQDAPLDGAQAQIIIKN